MPSETDARVWLRANGFSDVADAIDRIMAGWRERGTRTRRDWWEALAGTSKGKPTIAYGFTFPIIAEVRARFELTPVEGAIELPPGVTVPAKKEQARWEEKRAREAKEAAKAARKAAKAARKAGPKLGTSPKKKPGASPKKK